MTAVVQSSSPSSIQCGSPSSNDAMRQNLHHNISLEEEEERERKRRREGEGEGEEEDELSVLALFVTAFRKSLVRCYNKVEAEASISSSTSSWTKKMEIGLPSNVRHVAHVTFDRFNGFLGLPVEFEPEVPRRAPSASTTVFGVSTNSMQLSFDSRGNSVPTILLMMQRRLYALGGLEMEGIFRITAGNAQEEYVRDQLNKGVIPDDADVHCLAGLIKAWFRELPIGLLDSFSPEQLMESQTEEECAQLARTLPLTEASLLDWAVNLMADVAQHEHLNKMNPRNVAVVFAPNMTHVLDPLTALMHAVQVMNFLKTLIVRTLREREDAILDTPLSRNNPSDGDEPQSPLQTIFEGAGEGSDVNDELTDHPHSGQRLGFLNSLENILCGDGHKPTSINSDRTTPCDAGSDVKEDNGSSSRVGKNPRVCMEDLMKYGFEQGGKKGNVVDNGSAGKNKATDIVSRMNPRSERVEAWR